MSDEQNIADTETNAPPRRSIGRRQLLWVGLAGVLGIGAASFRRMLPNNNNVAQNSATVPASTASAVTPTNLPTFTFRDILPPLASSAEQPQMPTSTAPQTDTPEPASTPTLSSGTPEQVHGSGGTPANETTLTSAESTPSPPVPTNVPSRTTVPRPPIISQAEWGADLPAGPFIPHRPLQITLHHEGVYFDGSTPAAEYLRSVQHWCITDRGWPDIPYHFIIDLDGLIYEGRPLEARGDTNTAYNLQGHALVSLLGKYDAGEQEPAWPQIEATIAIMAWIAYTYDISPDHIHGHRDFIPENENGDHIDPRTGERITCPGDNLYRYLEDGTIQQGVAKALAHTN